MEYLKRIQMARSISRICSFVSAVVVFFSAAPAVQADELPVSPADLELLLPALEAGQREELLATGELSRFFTQGEEVLLVPGEDKRAEIDADLQSINFSVGVEVIHIIPHAYTDHSTADLATKLLEISTLAGLEYYSQSKDRMRTLFERSFTVDGAEERTPVADRVIAQVPASGTITVFQEDTTFGENINTITYDADQSSIHMLTTNESTFSWGFVPIIRPGRLRSHVLLIRTDTYMIYYANFGAQALRVNLFRNRIHDSFYNRLLALQGWFEAKLVD